MAESDASSSEMSDDALRKLVSRLAEVGGDLGGEESDAAGQSPGRAAGASNSDENSGDKVLLGAATGQPIWSTSTSDRPSPIQRPRGGSPRADGFDQDSDLFPSLDASDYHSEGQVAASLVVGTSGAAVETEAEAGSCGYEGDIGEGTKKLTASVRRAAVIAPPGFSACRDKTEEADDEASGKEVPESRAHQQAASLDVVGSRGPHFGSGNSFGVMPQMDEDSPWDALNESLREQGFREVSLTRPGGSITIPDSSVADTLRDVMFKHEERGKVIQEMSLELQRLNNVGGHRESVLNESFRRENFDLSRRSAEAEARVTALEEETRQLREQLAKETRRSKTENTRLASQLKQSEHRVKAKEASAQKLMDKLQDEAEKERLSQQRERAILVKNQQNDFFGSGANDSRVTQSLIAHSKAQERSKAEMDQLRAEVSRLGDELREKENTIVKHRLGPDWTPDLDQSVKATPTLDENLDLRTQLAESERSVRVMKRRETKALERCADIERECAEVQANLDETQNSLANVQLELSSRPSLRNWRASQRRMQDLETKLSQATTQAREAVGVAELRRWVDTKELMRRDRGNHRLKLDRLEELPAAVLKQVVQDSCRLLALQDVSLLSSSVSKLIKAVQMLPRLERFVNSVCSFVFRHSAEVLPAPSDGPVSQTLAGRERTMENVLPILELWLARAHAPIKLKDFQHDVLRVLDTRTGEPQVAPRGLFFKSNRAVISAIQHLVEFERRSLREVHQNEQADWSVNDDPSPVNRVVQHFQLLFGVSSIGGCIPKLNEVYRFSSETHTFLRTCGELLDIPEATSDTVIMRQLESILEGRIGVDADVCLRVSHDAVSWAASR